MSHPRRRIGIFAVALLTAVPALRASESGVRFRPPAFPGVVATTAWESAAHLWQALWGSWLPLDRPADSAAGRTARGRSPRGLTPTCDSGTSLDPNGRCVKTSARRPVLRPTCDSGTSIDPDGRCTAH
jgi:hypothetical protein